MRNKRPKYTGHRLSCPECKSLRVDARIIRKDMGAYFCNSCGHMWTGKPTMAAFTSMGKTQILRGGEFMKSDFITNLLKDM